MLRIRNLARMVSWSAAAVCVTLAASPAWSDGPRAPVRDPERTFSTYSWSFKELRERGVVMQKYDYSCGAAVLATICRYYWGDDVNEATFLELMPKLELTKEEMEDRIKNGLTLTDLRNLAQDAGYDAAMGKVQFGELAEGKVPVVVGLIVNKHEHFAVFRGTDGRYAYLADPIRGNVRTPIPDFICQWQKNAILLVAQKDSDAKKINPLGVRTTEVQRGVLNDQWINRNVLRPPIPVPLIVNP